LIITGELDPIETRGVRDDVLVVRRYDPTLVEEERANSHVRSSRYRGQLERHAGAITSILVTHDERMDLVSPTPPVSLTAANTKLFAT